MNDFIILVETHFYICFKYNINQILNFHCSFIYVPLELFSINNTLSNLSGCCPKISYLDVQKNFTLIFFHSLEPSKNETFEVK